MIFRDIPKLSAHCNRALSDDNWLQSKIANWHRCVRQNCEKVDESDVLYFERVRMRKLWLRLKD